MLMSKRTITVLTLVCVLGLILAAAPAAIAAPPAQGGGPLAIVNTPYLNQRTGPGPQYAIQGAHRGGSALPVIGRTAERDWWLVETALGVGWVNNEYVLTQNSFIGVPVVTEYGVLQQPVAIVIEPGREAVVQTRLEQIGHGVELHRSALGRKRVSHGARAATATADQSQLERIALARVQAWTEPSQDRSGGNASG